MNSDEAIEHILLATDDEPETRPRTTDYQFRQNSRSKGYRATYEIFNDHYLEVRIRKLHAKPRFYFIDLAFLDTQPLRCLTVDWPLLAIAFTATVITLALVVSMRQEDAAMVLNQWLPGTIATGTTAAVVGLFALYRSSDRLLFKSKHGGVPLLELLNQGRANKEFQAFILDLIERIQRAQAQYHESGREFLAAELREHRKLKEQAVITEENYEAGRRRILQSHGAA